MYEEERGRDKERKMRGRKRCRKTEASLRGMSIMDPSLASSTNTENSDSHRKPIMSDSSKASSAACIVEVMLPLAWPGRRASLQADAKTQTQSIKVTFNRMETPCQPVICCGAEGLE